MSPEAALDRLAVLSLAIESSIAEDRWEDVASLLESRLACLETLEVAPLRAEWRPRIAEALRRDARILDRLAGLRAETARAIAAGTQGRTDARKFANADDRAPGALA